MKMVANEQDCLWYLDGAIDYFWCGDSAFVWADEVTGHYFEEPLLVHNGNINKVWGWFVDYAVQNIMECLSYDGKTVEQHIVRTVINDNFERWLNHQRKLYPNRVCV